MQCGAIKAFEFGERCWLHTELVLRPPAFGRGRLFGEILRQFEFPIVRRTRSYGAAVIDPQLLEAPGGLVIGIEISDTHLPDTWADRVGLPAFELVSAAEHNLGAQLSLVDNRRLSG